MNAQAIISMRKKANLTQTELARLMYVSVQVIWKWEKGHSSPKGLFLATLLALQRRVEAGEDVKKGLYQL